MTAPQATVAAHIEDASGRQARLTPTGSVPVSAGRYVERTFIVPVLNSDAYDAGDVVSTSLITVPDCARVPGGTGRIVALRINDGDDQAAALAFWVFREPVTPAAADAANAFSDADGRKLITVLTSGPYHDGTNNQHSINDSLNSHFLCAPDSRALYISVATSGTPTYTTAAQLLVTLGIRQD